MTVISAADFFALVDRHIAPPMGTWGYALIDRYDEVSDSSRPVPLQLTPGRRRTWLRRWAFWHPSAPKEHVLTVGYEGQWDGEDDEAWLLYYPETG